MKVLIVEECPLEGQMLADMVLDQGHSVLGKVGSFEEANLLWREALPDLCIYDDKPDTAAHNWQWLSGMITRKPVPLIVSAREVRPEIREFSGEYAHLPKPASGKDLNHAVSDSVVKFRRKKPDDLMPHEYLSDRMFIKDHMNHYRRVMINEILWAKGEGNYTRIVTGERDYLIRSFLGDFLERMTANNFARTHKSYMINLRAVKEIRPTNVLIEETEVPLAKSYRSHLLERFQTY